MTSRLLGVSSFLVLFLLTVLDLTQAFAPLHIPSTTPRERVFSSQALWSTLSPTAPTSSTSDNDDDDEDKKKKDKTLPRRVKVVTSTSPKSSTLAPNTTLSYGPISMSVDELAAHLGGRGRARLAWDCYAIGVDPANYFNRVIRLGMDVYETIYDQLPSSRRTQRLGMPTLDALSKLYQQTCSMDNTTVTQLEGGVARLSHVSTSRDSTTKLLLQLADGLQVETVIIPWNGVRSTLCISSQVGCRQACRFCATGKMGLVRSLTSDEILAQMFWARKLCRIQDLPPVTNIVFMGMGEPADNAAAVSKAAQILTTRSLFQLAATKVTISTVAPTPQAFGQFAQAPAVLAWSVHAARDGLRRELVPTTKYSMAELSDGLIQALKERPMNFRTTMLEVVLIRDVNDDMDTDGAALVELSRKIVDAVPGCKLVVNLIPFNEIDTAVQDLGKPKLRPYKTPLAGTVRAFQKYLWNNGVYAHIRQTRGDDESAACGQLATAKQKQRESEA
eukprot:CAMPEP_0172451510 /NCGR_PEP_ID=MMETSP1065-20121228/9531_1 /TAXON_ID=265537 /ORGANISM="Amphiprora paludosa, Strain CCMP125" /LENGTH=502 /DNA_ID=CAMNT_0013203473 /DNA_START=263 /DNA_END=1771 /DNA_ORIENTATION=+